MCKIRKNFYLSKKAINHIKTKGNGNQSHYVDSLVIADMNKEEIELTEEDVIKLIEKYSKKE